MSGLMTKPENESIEIKMDTPRNIVEQLDRYIVGQGDAKRAVAIAIRNRWRRQQLPDELQQEISPKNIMMIGPTGVGKTEIARRLAKLTGAPFIKVEATKYTEVGYYGRDVESMVRELVENAIGIVRDRERKNVEEDAKDKTNDRLLDLLIEPPEPISFPAFDTDSDADEDSEEVNQQVELQKRQARTREKMRAMLMAGEMDHRMVEMTVESRSSPMVFSGAGMENMDVDLQGMFEKIIPKSTAKREMTVAEARKVIFEQECDALLDNEKINGLAIELAENVGIIFLDEIDKVIAGEGKSGGDVSRQGVQRDLLPIVEGTTIQTKYGYVRTDFILFVAAGAFHRNQPSDLMPELQGRFPIRVELNDLTKDDFVKILQEPRNSLTKQYAALMETEGITLDFKDDAIEQLASFAYQVNQTTQNIGARRLYTILEKVLEELSFEAADMKMGHVDITAEYVNQRLDKTVSDEDLSKFIL